MIYSTKYIWEKKYIYNTNINIFWYHWYLNPWLLVSGRRSSWPSLSLPSTSGHLGSESAAPRYVRGNLWDSDVGFTWEFMGFLQELYGIYMGWTCIQWELMKSYWDIWNLWDSDVGFSWSLYEIWVYSLVKIRWHHGDRALDFCLGGIIPRYSSTLQVFGLLQFAQIYGYRIIVVSSLWLWRTVCELEISSFNSYVIINSV